MHEILSFLLMALEIDLLGLETSRLKQDRMESHHSSTVHRCLLNESKLVNDAYSMFDAVMSSLALSYDGNPKSIGDETMTVIKEWAGDDQLADFMSSLDIPPVFILKWCRLMFSREVVGIQNVLRLWDELFFAQVSNSISFMNVLEFTAASMIILIRDKLLPSTATQIGANYHQPYDNSFSAVDDDDHEPIHLLMNYPRIQDISDLIQILQQLMSTQRNGVKPPKVQSRLEPQTDMNNYASHISYINEQKSREAQPPMDVPVADTMYFSQAPIAQPPMDVPVADTMYFSQGPINYDTPQVNQTQNLINNSMRAQHQDQIMATLKNLKNAPALAKLSSGLNAVRGAIQSIDLQSIDNPLKPQGSNPRPVVDNVYQPSVPVVAAKKEEHTSMSSNETLLGYRDLSTLPAIIDERPDVLQRNMNEAFPEGFVVGSANHIVQQPFEEMEGSFVGGGHGQISNTTFEGSVPVKRNASQSREASDVSRGLPERMRKSISTLAAYLKDQSLNKSNSIHANEAWMALGELERIQRELELANS